MIKIIFSYQTEPKFWQPYLSGKQFIFFYRKPQFLHSCKVKGQSRIPNKAQALFRNSGRRHADILAGKSDQTKP